LLTCPGSSVAFTIGGCSAVHRRHPVGAARDLGDDLRLRVGALDCTGRGGHLDLGGRRRQFARAASATGAPMTAAGLVVAAGTPARRGRLRRLPGASLAASVAYRGVQGNRAEAVDDRASIRPVVRVGRRERRDTGSGGKRERPPRRPQRSVQRACRGNGACGLRHAPCEQEAHALPADAHGVR
jgi:hypothetical protein